MKSFEEHRNFYKGGGDGGGGEEVNEPLFPPKTRKQFYEAIITGFDVELPKTIGKVVAEDTNGDPIENISLSFSLVEGTDAFPNAYVADMSGYVLNMTGHKSGTLIVEVNGAGIERVTPNTVSEMDQESMYYFLVTPDMYVQVITLMEPVGEFTVSAYWPAEVNDMTKLAPKTNKEKYLAKKAGLYDGELPAPKTAEEYYLYTMATADQK